MGDFAPSGRTLAEELTFIFPTQLLPSSTYPIRRGLQAAVYQTLID